MHIVVVGAGFSGAVIARSLAEADNQITLYEARDHVAGNCHTERDPKTGIMVHKYGPHIFHTDDPEVWSYVNRFAEFMPYIHRVKTTANEKVFSLPINLHTINQFFDKAMCPKSARNFLLGAKADRSIGSPATLEEQAKKFIGEELYLAFVKGYTTKQWGRDPNELPASILKRLPVRFSYNDAYFSNKFQGLPKEGYTELVSRILDHSGITLHLGSQYLHDTNSSADHVFYTGPIDAFFGYKLGRLAYRTLDFEEFNCDGDYQGCAVMNYADQSTPFTRITEHKHLSPWECHDSSVCYREFSREAQQGDMPYYPIGLVDEKSMLRNYVHLAETTEKVSFVGRLGTYRYLDMDVCIKEALEAATVFLKQRNQTPAFIHRPI